MNNTISRTRSTQGTTRSTVARKKVQLKNRKYGAQVSLLRAGKKVTVRTPQERRGIYDTLKSLNLNTSFRYAKNATGSYVISKRYSKK
jgi:hypothetical protein